MSSFLPLKINPFDLCDQGEILSGKLNVAQMVRICDIVIDSATALNARLDFRRDPRSGKRVIQGAVVGELALNCERCCQPMDYDINITINLSPVTSDIEAKRLPKEYDPLIVASDRVLLAELVEEELLLSLPMAPKHNVRKCPVNFSSMP